MLKGKRFTALVLTVIMVLTLCACGNNATNNNTNTGGSAANTPTSSGSATGDGDTATSEAAKTYMGNDVSDHVDLTLYYVGNEYGDEDMIFEAINKVMEEQINATITFKAISLSDYATNYSLLLAGGEAIDLIYTSSWCYYVDEAGKGAFLEITDDMIKQYMPQTYETQAEASYEQGMIDGKLYYMPACKIGYGTDNVLIRGDLRQKYGLEPLESIDDLYNYMAAVAADPDSGVAYAYNAALNGESLQDMMCVVNNNMVSVQNNYFYYDYTENPSADDIFFLYESDEFKDFAYKMKDWASQGFWSLSAINNQTDVKDSFLNGTSAVYIENLGTCGNVANSVKASNPEWQPEIYYLNMDNVVFAQYDNDGYAIPYTSENPERALMALDILKNNPEAYVTARYGIDGYHITVNDDGTWSQAANYGTWSYGAAVSWGLKNTNLEMNQDNAFPDQLAIFDALQTKAITNPTVAFSFSTTDIADSWANLTEVYTNYIPVLQLGLVDDVDGWLDEFYRMADAAGLEEVRAAIHDQVGSYIESH